MRLRHHAPAIGKINVTPLIDVVMVLIVFYLIVGKMASDRAAGVKLPGSTVGLTTDAAGLVISVLPSPTGKPDVLVDGSPVAPDALASAITARLGGASPSSVPVQVRADRRLPYGELAPVIDACRKAGLTSLKLVTQREGGA